MHTRGQTERVRVEHRVVRVEKVIHGAEYCACTVRVGRLEGRGGWERRVLPRIGHRRLHRLRLHVRRRERLRERAGTGGLIAGILVFKHVGLLIVLLLCTHGINLGRT